MTAIVVKEITCRKEKKIFVFLPETLHAHHENWIPPIYHDEWQQLDPARNPAFAYCDTLFLLAFRNAKPVGRALGIINRRYNLLRNEKTARFSHLECVEDTEIVRALLERIEGWALKRGMERVIGPYGFNDQDPEGFLIEGFGHRATIATLYNFEWLPVMVEACGYGKEIDYVTYRLTDPGKVPPILERMHARVLKRKELQVVRARKMKELKRWAGAGFGLMNEAYVEAGIFGFSPLDDREIAWLMKRYLPILDKRFVVGVTRGDELVAFIIGLPDMTEGIRAARGRLLPFGWLEILNARRKSRQLDLLLGAIKAEHRGTGAEVLIWTEMFRQARKAGFERADFHHQMEGNRRMRSATEYIGGEVYKRYRVYGKSLTAGKPRLPE